jgi:hypothetical protein
MFTSIFTFKAQKILTYNMDYYKKYLKYKNKYLRLVALINKNYMQYGGDLPVISNPNRINFFNDAHMGQYLNPIYGLVMYKSRFITNMWYLHKLEFEPFNTGISQVINKCCRKLPFDPILQPTNELRALTPIDFGRYIAIKYINMGGNNYNPDKNIIIKKNHQESKRIVFIDPIQNNPLLNNTIRTCVSKLNKFIPITNKEGVNYNEQIYFHIILYCMWWTANNNEGIMEYYRGINEIFNLINECTEKKRNNCEGIPKYVQIDLDNPPDDNIFESKLIEITNEKILLFNQEQAKYICNGKILLYPDCGETVLRNLINLLCFNGSIFDIEILKLFTPPQQLIEYYTNFNTFYSQSIVAGGADGLNARDKWSKLITSDAKKNIKFKRTCEDGSLYEVASGKAKDKSKSNFLQLIINLLGVSNWADFSKSEIIKIQDNTNHDGFGTLYITHYKFGKFEISCTDGHYSMKSLSKNKISPSFNAYYSHNSNQENDKNFYE